MDWIIKWKWHFWRWQRWRSKTFVPSFCSEIIQILIIRLIVIHKQRNQLMKLMQTMGFWILRVHQNKSDHANVSKKRKWLWKLQMLQPDLCLINFIEDFYLPESVLSLKSPYDFFFYFYSQNFSSTSLSKQVSKVRKNILRSYSIYIRQL